MTSVYSISLITLEFIFYIACMIILFKTYKQTRYLSHLLQGISIGLLLMNGILRFSTSFFTEEIVIYVTTNGVTISVVGILWSLMNAFLIPGIFLLFISFFYVKMNSFHPILNIISIIIGASILAFSYPTFTELNFDAITKSWRANYNILVMVLIIPLFIVFVISIILPVITKIRKSSYRELKRQMAFQVIGLGIVLVWSFLVAFTSHEMVALVRPFLMPVGWLIWSLTLLVDPFNIMVSNAKVTQIYIATEDGIPFYFKDIQGTQNLSSTLAASIISGVKTALEELVQRKDKVTVLNYEKQVLGIVSVGALRAYVFGERVDKILETVLKFLLQMIQKDPKLMFQISSQVIFLDEESTEQISLLVNEALKSVLIL
ncbi:MAG: hypothetical protein JXA54_04320 [Candidatus Heimdallarchaeota archaeon]|nr:hypothetical protein [Candidatus Heimdallarchaeota archaeon]